MNLKMAHSKSILQELQTHKMRHLNCKSSVNIKNQQDFPFQLVQSPANKQSCSEIHALGAQMGAAHPDSPPPLTQKENSRKEITLTTKELWKGC